MKVDHNKPEHLHVRISQEDRVAFLAVAEALGLADMSNAVRFVMREKHRALGLATPGKPATKPARTTQAR